MRRILVLGCCGAGKSLLSRQLAEANDLPLIHLDAHYWRPGWVEPEAAEWRSTVERLVAQPAWVMDGNYKGTLDLRLPRAELVVLLEPGRLRCLQGALGRIWRHRGETRPDMGAGCPERLDLDFLRYIWTFDAVIRPRVEQALAEHYRDGRVVRLASRAEVAGFLASKRPQA